MQKNILLALDTKANYKEFDELQQEIRVKIAQVDAFGEKLYNNHLGLENYMNKYLPLTTFTQTFEILRVMMPQDFLNKVQQYEKVKLKFYYK